MLDLFYSGVVLSLVALWLFSANYGHPSHLLRFMKAHSRMLIAFVWAVFLGFAAAYVVYFDQLNHMHDIPNAVDAAISSQDHDLNPYNHSVVPRFESRYSSSVSVAYGPYNYLPFDLDVYSFFEWMLGFLGMPYWFVLANVIFASLALVLLRELLRVSWRVYLPVAGMAVLFYSFDNVSLTLLLLVGAMFLYQRRTANYRMLAIVIMGLAMMTKIHAAIPFGVLVLYELERYIRSRDRRLLLKISGSVATSGAIATLLMLPFGIGNVIKSAVLFHADTLARAGTSTGGTLLTEFPLASTEYTLIVVAVMVVALAASMRLARLTDRMLIVSIAFLLVAVKSSQALLMVPGIFLPLKLREISDSESSARLEVRHDPAQK